MQIDRDMIQDGSIDFYNQSFRDTLEAHIPYFRGSVKAHTIQIAPNDTIVYNQDLFGYLNKLQVLPCYQWLIMRINNMFSPYDFGPSFSSLVIPDSNDVESIRMSWNATTVINS